MFLHLLYFPGRKVGAQKMGPFKTQVFEEILWAKFDLRDSFGLITIQMSGG